MVKLEENKVKLEEKNKGLVKFKSRFWISDWDSKKVMLVIKLLFLLGLVIFLGLLYSKLNGYWVGLLVVISFVVVREVMFKVVNVKV